jgi:hypothetical protein
MPSPPFDPSKAVTFDLSRGQIRDEGAHPRVLVPAAALFALAAAADPDAAASFAREVGASIGAAVAHRFERAGTSARAATLDEIAEQLGGELSIAGFGVLGIERWGRALVFVVDDGLAQPDGDRLLAPLLAAAVTRATGIEARSVRLTREGRRARFLISNLSAAERVRNWIDSGVSWGEALVRLHANSADARRGVEP